MVGYAGVLRSPAAGRLLPGRQLARKPAHTRALAELRAKVVDADREAMAGNRSGERLPQPRLCPVAMRDDDSACGPFPRPRPWAVPQRRSWKAQPQSRRDGADTPA